MARNKIWNYRGQSHYGDYDSFQRFREHIDTLAAIEREQRRAERERQREAARYKDWTLPDKSHFHGTFEEFTIAKQQVYDRWNREKEERRKKREYEEEVRQNDRRRIQERENIRRHTEQHELIENSAGQIEEGINNIGAIPSDPVTTATNVGAGILGAFSWYIKRKRGE